MGMDKYDIDYQQLGYNYDKTIHLPLKVLFIRKAMYAAQILMLIGAIICASGASIAQRNGIIYTPVPFGRMENELVWVAWGCAGVSMIASFIGCIGARNRSRVALVVYLLFVGIALGLGITSTAQAFADSGNTYNYAMRQWRGMTIHQTLQFQQTFLCCNFDTVMPCCRRDGQGDCINEFMCYERVDPHLTENFHIIAATSTVQSIYLFAVALFSLFLCKFIEYYNPNTNGKGGIEDVSMNDYDGGNIQDDDDFFK